MAHFLTTNWTEKIKTNPVANMILNSHRPKLYNIRLYGLSHHPPKGKKMTKDFINKYQGRPVREETLNEEDFKEFISKYASFDQRIKSHDSVVAAQQLELIAKDGGDAGIAGSGIAVGDDDDVVVVADRGSGEEEKGEIVGDGAIKLEGDDLENEPYIYHYEETRGGDMWENVFVDDYINIHHPKLRYDYISALTGKPLQIKPPSVFFSDV